MKRTRIFAALTGLALMAVALPALAQNASGTPTTTPRAGAQTVQQRIDRAKVKANQEIDRRIKTLQALNTRIQAMKRISATDKATLAGRITTEITALTTLKAKIAADTDLAVLKEDVKSITKSYRIYALILPQVQILAAADRLLTLSDLLAELGVKLKTEIDAVAAEGKSVSTLNTTLADFNAKVTDAKAQANTAITKVSALVPDGGDTAKAAANKQALQDARAAIRKGTQDAKIARQDAKTIRQLLRMFRGDATTTPATP